MTVKSEENGPEEASEKMDEVIEKASDKKTSKGPAEEKDELKEAKEQAERYLDMARRLQADFDNFRKRTQKENDEFRKYANEEMAKELLNIVDDMDRALATAKEESDLVVGIRGIRQNLMKILESRGLTEIPTDGGFDPAVHEALCTVDGDTDGEIAEVFQKGYRMNGRVIRYSKVKVTKKIEE